MSRIQKLEAEISDLERQERNAAINAQVICTVLKKIRCRLCKKQHALSKLTK